MADAITLQRIIEVRTERGVDSVRDLKKEIDDLKTVLLNTDKASGDYDKALNMLRDDQRRLNEVTALTKKENVAVQGSYYDLNAQLVEARKQWKDLSAEERNNADVGGALRDRIQDLDRQLKDMDASIGQFQRNVGDYRGALNEFGETLHLLPEGAGKTVDGFRKMGEGMKLLSTNPLMGTIRIITPILIGIADSIRGNASAMEAINKAMEALKPVADLVGKGIETLAGWIGKAVTGFADMLKGSKETFASIVAGAAGVGNVLKEAFLRPFDAIISGLKGIGKIFGDIFHGEFDQIKGDAQAAGQGIKKAFSEAYDIKGNYQKGADATREWLDGIMSKEPEAKAAAQQVAASMSEEAKKVWMSEADYYAYILQQRLALAQKGSADELAVRKEQRQQEYDLEVARLEDSIENEQDRITAIELATAVFNQDMLQMDADYNAALQKQQEDADKARADEKAAADKKRKDEEKREQEEYDRLQQAKQAAVKNSLSAIMSMYEVFYGENAKQQQGYKLAASAQAMIDAYLAANEAYSSMASIPYVGPALGIAAAAAALASGLANVRAINSVSATSGGSASAPSSTSAPIAASVSAPAVIQQVQTTRSLTSASEEERINQAQRVYLVYDDVQQAGRRVAVQDSESTF